LWALSVLWRRHWLLWLPTIQHHLLLPLHLLPLLLQQTLLQHVLKHVLQHQKQLLKLQKM
jgi:predicted lipid carrier protein YhbT